MREQSGQRDPTWQTLELLMVIVYVLEVLILWLDASLESVEQALAFLNGRLIIDALIIPSVLVSNLLAYEGQYTWFSLSWVACLRALGLWKTYLDSIPSNVMMTIQIANIAISSIVAIFFFGTLIRTIESFTGAPPFPEDAHTADDLEVPKNKWTFLASIYFIFVTTSTVGYGDMTPKTIPGQLFTIVIIMGGIAGFSYVCSELMAAYQMSAAGGGDYALKRRTRHIIVTGSPSSQMVADFLNEVYHEDHKKESADLEVVILASGQGNLLESLRNFLKRKSNEHIKNRVVVLQGSPLDQGDLYRVRVYAAAMVFVLPNFYTSEPVQDDTENIMRVMSLRREAPRVRIIILIHKAEHRSLVLSGGAATSDVICLDEFKLGMVGKTCHVPGFATLVCNLCKTISDDDLTDEAKDWKKLYETGLGNELYEVELSLAYRNRRFADVVMDVLNRSEGAAYLIGVVEEALQIGDAATLRVNPGQTYQIRDDRRCYGIFMAQDREAIMQQKPGEADVEVLAGKEPTQPGQIAKKASSTKEAQLNASMFAPLSVDSQLPNAVPDPIEEHIPGSTAPVWTKETGNCMRAYEDMLKDRAKIVAAKHVAQRLWQRRVLPKQDIEDLLNVKLPEEDPDPELTEIDYEEDVLYEAQELLKDMGPISGTTTSPQVAAVKHHQHDLSEQQHFEALRVGFSKMRTPKEPPPALLAKGGHILFCTLNSRGENVKKGMLGKRLGFEHFLKPLRSSMVQPHRPIVVLAPLIPADWYTAAAFSDVYFVQGSPISAFDLTRTAFDLAHAIMVHQPGTAEGVSDPMMVDSDVIFASRLMESKLSQSAHRPPIIVDLMFDLNHTFVPLEGADDPGDANPLIQFLGRSGTSAMGGDKPRMKVGKFAFAQMNQGSLDEKSSADKLDESMGQMEETGFYKQSRFACGTLFVSSTVTSLVVNTMYNPSLAMLVKELISAQYVLVPVPIECHGWSYHQFFERLLRGRDLISLAIVRRTDAVVPEEDDEHVPPPGMNKSQGWGKAAKVYRYVQTAPTANSRIVFDDQILCVPPNTNDCALKNPIPVRRHVGPVL